MFLIQHFLVCLCQRACLFSALMPPPLWCNNFNAKLKQAIRYRLIRGPALYCAENSRQLQSILMCLIAIDIILIISSRVALGAFIICVAGVCLKALKFMCHFLSARNLHRIFRKYLLHHFYIRTQFCLLNYLQRHVKELPACAALSSAPNRIVYFI